MNRNHSAKRQKHWFLLQAGDPPKEVASKLFTQVAAVVLVACLVILFDYYKASFMSVRLSGSLKDLYGSITSEGVSGKLLPSAEKLLAVNEDTVGWVEIPDTKVAQPVVLKNDPEVGNTYYLTKNFNGQKAKAGTVFLDYRSTLTAKKQSDNLVLYGHNEKDNTMFGDLDRYKNDLDFYRAHPTVSFNSNYKTGIYKIIAVFVTTVEPRQSRDGRVFDYQNYIDMDKGRYKDFIDNVMERTQINTTVDYKYGDSFLTLSTCSNEFEPSRFVIVARAVRKGESEKVDVEGAKVNDEALKPDLKYIYSKG